MLSSAPQISTEAWQSLRGLARAKYAGHTPLISQDHLRVLMKAGFAVRTAGIPAVTDAGEAALATWNNYLAGRYRSLREKGVEYTYEAEWTLVGHALAWRALVSRDGAPAGVPDGKFHGVPANVPEAVRDFVENAIEKRASVE